MTEPAGHHRHLDGYPHTLDLVQALVGRWPTIRSGLRAGAKPPRRRPAS